ncbi:MAG: polysaccharide deacetylase family protein, partial [Clostridia bacterium]
MRKNTKIFAIFLLMITSIVITTFSVPAVQAKSDTDVRYLPIIMYHQILKSRNGAYIVSPKQLENDIVALKEQGYTTVLLREVIDFVNGGCSLPKKPIIITFDDGYMDNYYNAFPILKDFNMVATIFCITSNLDGTYYLSKEALNEMSSYGIDIESHTVNHPHLDKMTYNQQLAELKDSKKTLELITGIEVNSIAYPFGDFNDDSIKAAKDAGYTLG